MWEQLNSHMEKVLNLDLLPYTKVNLKERTDLNVKALKNMREKLPDRGRDFLGYIKH